MLPTRCCVYCTFRRTLLTLQCRRLRSSAASSNRRHPPPPPDSTARKLLSGHVSPTFRYNESKHSPMRKIPARNGRPPTRHSRNPEHGLTFHNGQMQADYPTTLLRRLAALEPDLRTAPVLSYLAAEQTAAGESPTPFPALWRAFISRAPHDATLRTAFHSRGLRGLDDRLRYAFHDYITSLRTTPAHDRSLRAAADLRHPSEWFPFTRSLHRTVHLHVGPTNSGKTYHALQRLERANKGVYAGPLRLLAHEVYTRMNARGRACTLITGEERRMAPEDNDKGATAAMRRSSGIVACTVEMMPLGTQLDVAVIDEIQMIGNAERGWAWTQALLGVAAQELHLCGEERTVPLIRALCASVGDTVHVHHYERLSPLHMAKESLEGDLRRLRKGDCIVSFSVMGIHALRREIERRTGRKVATVYGSLPPETRAQQARLFNDPDNEYDFLVASDAVGMGLNLAIKRIIFESTVKFDGFQQRGLSVADIKQIAGRAGRYRTAHQDNHTAEAERATTTTKTSPHHPATAEEEAEDLSVSIKGDRHPTTPPSAGLVTTLETLDHPIVSAALPATPPPILTAGLFPPAALLDRFASYLPPGTPFSYTLTRLHELAQTTASRFHLCGLTEQTWIADLIEPVRGLSVADRNIICAVPASKGDAEMWASLMPAFARCVAGQGRAGGDLPSLREMPLEVLEWEGSATSSREYLRGLERLHKGLVGYLWLSYRFAGVFTTRALGVWVKGLVEARIEEVLGRMSFGARRKRDGIIGVGDELQTSVVIGGGDRFGGEEAEVVLGDVESGGEEMEALKSGSVGSSAEWRGRQVRGEVKGSNEEALLNGDEDFVLLEEESTPSEPEEGRGADEAPWPLLREVVTIPQSPLSSSAATAAATANPTPHALQEGLEQNSSA